MPKIDIVNAKNIIESNPEKAFFKLKNTGGPKGDSGAQGPQGPKGDTGPQGAPGASASVTVGSTTTLSPGADATVTNSGDTRNAILNFGIPTGAKGPKGDTGSKGDTGPMGPKGAKGDTGAAATVQVGNTNTGAPGTNAQVTNAGNEHFAVFNFTIPRGDKGETGSTGAQGPKGDKGDTGAAGQAATITVGSTTTTNPGTNATVTNSGTTSAAVLNFGIPRGATGSVKSDVVAELPETGEEDTFYLVNREAAEQTATGKIINFTNNENTGDITDFKLDGETSQNGTPTPSAPVAVQTTTGENVVKICGKNLLDIETTSNRGVDLTYNSATGEIQFSGTPTGTWCIFALPTITIPAGTYTLSIPQALSFTIGLGLTNSGGTRTTRNVSIGNTSYTFTTTESMTLDLAIASITSGASFSASTKLQLELGSLASSFEPYQGSSYEVNLGKNLLKVASGSATRNQSAITISNGDINYTASASGTSFAAFGIDGSSIRDTNYGDFVAWGGSKLAPGTYTLSVRYISGSTTTVVGSGGNFLDIIVYGREVGSTERVNTQIAKASVNTTDQTATFTLTEEKEVNIVAYMYANSPSANINFNVQLEKGSQATSYAAYFEPIELCKIGDYQDYIYKDGSDWKIHKAVGKYTLTGSEDWTLYSTGVFYAPAINSMTMPVNAAAICYSANYKGCTSSLAIGDFITEASSYSYAMNVHRDTKIVRIKNTDIATADALKTWLAGNETSVYYPIATATNTAITNTALIEQLDNLASAPLYTGVNNITTITPNEQGTLEIKYVTYDKYNQNKVYIWNDTLQQWQIIVP